MGIDQYQVILVNLDPTVGSEIRKTRPCVVISPVEMNKHLNTLVIAPLTTSKTQYPTRVKIKFKRKTGQVVLDQIRTIDKSRMIKMLGYLNNTEISEIKRVINEIFVQ
jgi:mRNA interferase MazF